jgi:quinol monooxygenase YgiN
MRIAFLSSMTVLIGMVFFRPFVATAFSFRGSSKEPTFSLLVTLQFSLAEHKEKFLRDFQPLADYVKVQELDTLAYEVLLSEKDPLQVMIMERYKDKDVAYLMVHKSSAPFLAFRPKLQAMQEAGHVTISGNSYLDSGVGFGDRV